MSFADYQFPGYVPASNQEYEWCVKFVWDEYSQPHRAYHTWHHIHDMFGIAGQLGEVLTVNQRLAILYHDIVYIPGSSENERLSAMLLKTHVAQNKAQFKEAFPEANLEIVESIIRDTKNHLPSQYNETKLVLDLDMSILGAEPDRYQKYVKDVMFEYAEYAGERMNKGRAEFLQTLLLQPNIFLTDVCQAKFESKARDNIKAELETLI